MYVVFETVYILPVIIDANSLVTQELRKVAKGAVINQSDEEVLAGESKFDS
jgi:hypothetical protein